MGSPFRRSTRTLSSASYASGQSRKRTSPRPSEASEYEPALTRSHHGICGGCASQLVCRRGRGPGYGATDGGEDEARRLRVDQGHGEDLGERQEVEDRQWDEDGEEAGCAGHPWACLWRVKS